MSDTPATPLFTVRPGQPDDVPLIFSSWLKSFRDSPAVAGIPNSIYYPAQHRVIEKILPRAVAGIACNDLDPTQIFGYIVGRSYPDYTVIDWLYVKHAFRGFGIARDLVAKLVGTREVIYYTHRAKFMDRLLHGRPYVYHPYLLPGVDP